jgi:hypothetical protein
LCGSWCLIEASENRLRYLKAPWWLSVFEELFLICDAGRLVGLSKQRKAAAS